MLAIGNAVDGRPFGRFGGFNFGAPKIRTFPTFLPTVERLTMVDPSKPGL